MKIFLQLRGRENQYEELAIAKIQEFVASMEDFYRKDEKSKILKQGNTFNLILYPKNNLTLFSHETQDSLRCQKTCQDHWNW